MAKTFQRKRVLYFIQGPVPTPEDNAEAMELAGQGLDVVFRNACMIQSDLNPRSCEPFDELAGAVPDVYYEAERMRDAATRKADFAEAKEAEAATKPQVKLTAAEKAKAKSSGKVARQAAVSADDEGRKAALAALTGGEAPVQVVTAPAGAQTGAWGQQAAQQTPPAEKPVGWSPNA